MRKLLALITFACVLAPAPVLAVSSPTSSNSGYSRPAVGTTVVVTRATSTRPAVTAKVPPAQTTGAAQSAAKTVKTYGTPYSPSGYTTSSGRAAAYSPVTHSYVEVHHYWYSDMPFFAGYYGCLGCFSGPYAYAPVPFAPASYVQPSWAFDMELLLLALVVVVGLLVIGRWWGRRA